MVEMITLVLDRIGEQKKGRDVREHVVLLHHGPYLHLVRATGLEPARLPARS